MAQFGYTPTTDEEENDFKLLPNGDYKAIVSDSDYVQNSMKTGMVLKLTYQIIEGDGKDQKVFENLNLENESVKAKQISERSFNSLKKALGLASVQDTTQLHGIPLVIRVGIEPPSNGYKAKNTVEKHFPINGATPPSTGFQQPTPPVNGGSESQQKKQPWDK